MADDTGVSGSMQASGDMAGALQDLLRQICDKIIGGPSKDKAGRPLSDVCVMVMPLGQPIDPRDFSDPWDPAGGDTRDDFADDGKLGTAALQKAAPAAPTPVAGAGAGAGAGAADVPPPAPAIDEKLVHSQTSARNITQLFDQMLRVTSDGTYRPFTSAGTLSSSYELIITKAQGIPAPPPSPDIQKRIDEAMHVIHVYGDDGKVKGFTKEYKTYQALKQAYADAEAAYANAFASSMTSQALGSIWPVTSKSLKTAIDSAYDDWRSSGADEMENALETVKSVGGSIGAHFVAEAKYLYDAWSLGLSGTVGVGTPYTQIMPGSWYDPTDDDIGFTGISASHTQWTSSGQSQSSSLASSWYKGHSSSTGAAAGGMVFGIAFGGSGSHTTTGSHDGSSASGQQTSSFGSRMSNVSIKLQFGLCTILRPWLLRELFTIDGWFLPGEKDKVVSDGTIGGQQSDDDKHILPMIPTRFLVIRNVTITADGWGSAGDQMSQHCRSAQDDSSSSSSSAKGGVGFLCFGGSVSKTNADWAGDDSRSASAARSWYFSGDQNHGVLTINGCQIVGYVGEIVPASPQVDGTKQPSATAAPVATASPAH